MKSESEELVEQIGNMCEGKPAEQVLAAMTLLMVDIAQSSGLTREKFLEVMAKTWQELEALTEPTKSDLN